MLASPDTWAMPSLIRSSIKYFGSDTPSVNAQNVDNGLAPKQGKIRLSGDRSSLPRSLLAATSWPRPAALASARPSTLRSRLQPRPQRPALRPAHQPYAPPSRPTTLPALPLHPAHCPLSPSTLLLFRPRRSRSEDAPEPKERP